MSKPSEKEGVIVMLPDEGIPMMDGESAEVRSRASAGETPTVRFVDDFHVEIDGVPFSCGGFVLRPPSHDLVVQKPRAMIEKTLERTLEFSGGNVVEIGICRGGSTAMFAKLLRPRKLVAIERDAVVSRPLETFVEDHALGDTVKPFYGVDQGDRESLTAIVDEEFDGDIDLIVDDASHLYGPTRNSFEVLFPRLREGGVYMIEDWQWEHHAANLLANVFRGPEGVESLGVISEGERAGVRGFLDKFEEGSADENATFPEVLRAAVDLYASADGQADLRAVADAGSDAGPKGTRRSALTSLVLQLVLLHATARDVIRDITIDECWVVVRRGSTPIERANFSVYPEILDCFGQLSRPEPD